jgi:hypothetical protein
MYVQHNTEARSLNHCSCGKAISISYYECVSRSLLLLSGVKWHLLSTVLYCYLRPLWLNHIFPHYHINCTIFGKTFLNIKRVFSLLSETFLIPRRIQREMTINVHRSSCEVPVILDRSESNLNFLNRFSKNPQISNFI